MVDLKPCPFCEREPVRNGRIGVGGVLCAQGEHRVQVYGKDQREVDERWNTRTPPVGGSMSEDAGVERLRDILDTERYKVAIGVQAIKRALNGRRWLSEGGRGSHTYDDERYQQEFGAAIDEIDAALAPLRAIARDWSDCPRDPLRVAANRSAALRTAEPAREDGADAPPAGEG